MKMLNVQRTFFLLLAAVALAAGCGRDEPEREQLGDAPGAAANSFSDAAITAEVKAKIAVDEDLSTLTEIEVTTESGVVTLTGAVDTPEIRGRAEEIARGVKGVVSVTNNIQVPPQ